MVEQAQSLGLKASGFANHFVQTPDRTYPHFKPGGPEVKEPVWLPPLA